MKRASIQNVTDLYYSKGKTHKFWSAAIRDNVVLVSWGRIGATPRRKSMAHASRAAAQKTYRNKVDAKRQKGYLDARPSRGAPAFIASRHRHDDIVYVSESGILSCATCWSQVPHVVVGRAGGRPAPDSDYLLRPVTGLDFQMRYVWPLAATLPIGTEITADALLDLVRRALDDDPASRRIRKRFDASRTAVWRARAKPRKRALAPIDKIGGEPSWIGPEQWPTCSSCGDEMMFVAQFRAGPGTAIPLAHGRAIYVFACEDGCFDAGSSAVIVQPNANRACRRDPDYEPCGAISPQLVLSLTKSAQPKWPDEEWSADDSERTAAALWYRSWESREAYAHATQIGGHPHWVQGAANPKCPTCRRDMRFVAQIDSMMHRAKGLLARRPRVQCAIHEQPARHDSA